MRWSRTKGQSGFTLVELLVVVMVLGVVSGVVVLAVGGLHNNTDAAACGADERALKTAQEVHMAQHHTYADEDELVSAGLLDAASTNHDVKVDGTDYEVVPTGDCLELINAELAAGGSTTTTAAPTPEELKAAEEAAANDAAAKAAEEAKAAEQAKAAEEAAAKEAAAKEAAAKKAGEKAAEPAVEPGGCAKGQININTADKATLQKIDHIEGAITTRVIKQRPFKSLEELVTVKGLDEGDVKDIINDGEACVA